MPQVLICFKCYDMKQIHHIRYDDSLNATTAVSSSLFSICL